MMKSHVFATLLIGCAVLANFGCAPAPTVSNGNVAVATPEPTPDQAVIVTELTRIENDWPRIIKERDGATVRRIEADDIVIIYPDGTLGNKEQDAKDIEAGYFTFDSWDTLEVKVNVLSKDYALVMLRYDVKNGVVKAPDGRSEKVSGQYLSLDTFTRRNGQWQFVGLSSVQVKAPVAATSPSPGASPAASRVAQPRPTLAPRSSPVTRSTPAPRPSTPRPTPPRTVATPTP
jgi:hypothetical protein